MSMSRWLKDHADKCEDMAYITRIHIPAEFRAKFRILLLFQSFWTEHVPCSLCRSVISIGWRTSRCDVMMSQRTRKTWEYTRKNVNWRHTGFHGVIGVPWKRDYPKEGSGHRSGFRSFPKRYQQNQNRNMDPRYIIWHTPIKNNINICHLDYDIDDFVDVALVHLSCGSGIACIICKWIRDSNRCGSRWNENHALLLFTDIT